MIALIVLTIVVEFHSYTDCERMPLTVVEMQKQNNKTQQSPNICSPTLMQYEVCAFLINVRYLYVIGYVCDLGTLVIFCFL